MMGRISPETKSNARILFVSHDLTLSGAPLLLFHLAKWCCENNFSVAVAALTDGALEKEFIRAGIPLTIEQQIGERRSAFKRMICGFDVVVANTVKTAPVVIAAREEGVPCIWWVHETKLGERFLQKDSRISVALTRADRLIAPSQSSLAIYSGHAKCPKRKLVSGIPDFREKIRARPRRVNELHFLMLGTIEKRKGQDLLVAAIQGCHPKIAQQAVFDIVGSNVEGEFLRSLRSSAANLANIRIRNAVDHETALQILADADALICASRDEAMPLTILEAMCFGKTIVATSVGGIPEYLTDGINAILVAPDDAQVLANAVERVVGDRKETLRLGENARALFEARHTVDQMGRDFAEIASNVIGERRRKSVS